MKANMPGFTAASAIYPAGGPYQPAMQQDRVGDQQRVIPQLPIGVGGGRLGGFWECLGCVAACGLVTGDPVVCYYACRDVGACLTTAVTARL
jgi:hypothetical protein